MVPVAFMIATAGRRIDKITVSPNPENVMLELCLNDDSGFSRIRKVFPASALRVHALWMFTFSVSCSVISF